MTIEERKRYRVTGTQYYERNTMKLATENPNYALSEAAIVKGGLAGKYIYRYSFLDAPVTLEQEPDNPYDPNAIKVIVAGQHVGHIKAGSCAHLNKVINEGRIKQISCRIYGGPYKCVYDYSSCPDDEPEYELEDDATPIKVELSIIETKEVENTMFCKHCGAQIDKDCVVCPKCGKQVGQLKSEQPNIIINNSNSNTNTNVNKNVNAGFVVGKAKSKWVAFLLCLFLGYLGIHRFYEGKVGTGVIWLFTGGLFGIGWIVDLILILLKPNPYYVK